MVTIVPKVRFRNKTYILTLMSCERVDALLREMLSASLESGHPKGIWILRADTRTTALFREKQFGPCSLTETSLTRLKEIGSVEPVRGGRKDTGTILVRPNVRNIVAEMGERARKNNLAKED